MQQFNFSEAAWLWGLAAVPAMILVYALYYRGRIALDRLKRFADAHLLPHLVKNRPATRKSARLPLVIWSLAWICGVLALAGPRWDYTDVQTGMPDRALVILLDLSKSMDAQDVRPSRLARAKEEIGDIIDAGHGINIGLIAFAAIPHMIAPVTDDMGTIRYIMPSLDTKLVSLQGSRLAPALEMAALTLKSAPGKEKSILIISDGGIEDAAGALRTLPPDVHVYAMGVGTAEGAPIPADDGGWVKDSSGSMVLARLDDGSLRAIAEAGGGIYVTADYGDSDTRALLGRIDAGPESHSNVTRTVRVWDEKFYIPALVMALLMLPWFRKGCIFPMLALLALSAAPARAASMDELFLNQAQQAREAFDQKDYEGAARKFDTPYRRGIAEYRAGKYDEAIASFNADSDPQTAADSQYNLGNSQLMAGRPEEAIASYESYLKQRPGDKAAARNLEIARKVLEQKNKEQDKQQQKQDQKQQDQQKQNQQQQSQQQDQKQQQQKNQQQAGDSQNQNDKGQQQKTQDQTNQQQKDPNGQQSQPGQDKQAQQGEQKQNQQQQGQQKQEPQSGKEKQAQQQGQQQDSGDKNSSGEPKPQRENSTDSQGKGEKKEQKEKQDAQNGKNADQKAEQKPGGEEQQEQQKQQSEQEKQAEQQSAQDKKNQEQQAQSEDKKDQQQEQQQQPAQEKQTQQKNPDQTKNQSGGSEAESKGEKPQGREQAAAQQQQQHGNGQESSPQPMDGDTQEQVSPPADNQPPAQNSPRSQADVDADQWLSRTNSDPGVLLKNQFSIEEKKSGTRQEDDPW